MSPLHELHDHDILTHKPPRTKPSCNTGTSLPPQATHQRDPSEKRAYGGKATESFPIEA